MAKKSFFKWQRNPFKLVRSYIGAIIGGLIPFPIAGMGGSMLIPNFIFSLYIPRGFILSMPLMFAGFFLAASTKKGKDNFLQYGVISLIVSVISFYLMFFTSFLGSLQ